MTIRLRYILGSNALIVVGLVVGMILMLTTHWADAHVPGMTEKVAHETALDYAETAGLVGDPATYTIQRMTRGEWAELVGDIYPETTTADLEQDLWLVAFTGDIQLKGPSTDYSGPGEKPAGYNNFAYYLVAMDAVTGANVGTSARYEGSPQPLEANRPVPVGEYSE